MNENPYDILGVSRDASLDEVKKAYRKKARENHPDLNPDDTAAADRMNKINEAYDRIINPDKYAREDARKRNAGSPTPGYPGAGEYGYSDYGNEQSGWSTSQNGGNPYQQGGFSWEDIFGGVGAQSQAAKPIHPEAEVSDSPEIRRAINLINAENYAEATNVLSEIPSTGRNARWYYLSAIANHGAGNSVQALDQIRRAQRMDPSNSDYEQAEKSFTQSAANYEQQSDRRGFSVGFLDPQMLCCCALCVGMGICSYSRMFCFF